MKIEVKDAGFGYNKEKIILSGLNFELKAGEVLSVLGANGVGKTTMIKCIVGLLKWVKGASYIDEKDITSMTPKEIWSKISYIPQARGFAFSYTGLEMVLLGRSVHIAAYSQPSKKDIEIAEEVMEKIGISHLANQDCNTMSGGQLQMVLIARAIVSNPRMLVLDEPESGLDFRNQLLVLNLIEKLVHEDGLCAIMNTHYPVNALRISDKTLMLCKDKSYMYGETKEILVESKIQKAFKVEVVMNKIMHNGKELRDIIPISL